MKQYIFPSIISIILSYATSLYFLYLYDINLILFIIAYLIYGAVFSGIFKLIFKDSKMLLMGTIALVPMLTIQIGLFLPFHLQTQANQKAQEISNQELNKFTSITAKQFQFGQPEFLLDSNMANHNNGIQLRVKMPIKSDEKFNAFNVKYGIKLALYGLSRTGSFLSNGKVCEYSEFGVSVDGVSGADVKKTLPPGNYILTDDIIFFGKDCQIFITQSLRGQKINVYTPPLSYSNNPDKQIADLTIYTLVVDRLKPTNISN